ncbi:hypothetical protein [Streptomyces parvulus]|uniref:hypothetical protein n=1 Tax=Streptomyces parvulus TaxID=146923 RepID=UPI0037BCFAEF
MADDQLAQSKEDGEKEQRAAASRVTWWGDGGESITVANRTLDPVLVTMFLQTREMKEQKSSWANYIYFGVVPPCTSVSVPEAAVRDEATRRNSGEDWLLRGVHFVLSDGTSWVRHANNRALAATEVPLPTGLANPEQPGGLLADPDATTIRMEQCRS